MSRIMISIGTLTAAGLIWSAAVPAAAQQSAPDRRDDMISVLQASRGYSDTIAANCLYDARTQLAAKDAEIAKLKAEIKAAGETKPSE